MNLENKRKTFEKDYYKPTPAATPSSARSAAGPSSRKTPALTTGTIAPIASPEPACRYWPRRPRVRLRRDHGARGRLGEKGR